MLGHPNVVDVAVIPIPNENAGEVPKAFVALSAPVIEDELAAFVTDKGRSM